MAVGVNAAGENIWKSGQNFQVTSTLYNGPESDPPVCTKSTITLINLYKNIHSVEACVSELNGVSIARYTDRDGTFVQEVYAVQKPGDLIFNIVIGLDPSKTEIRIANDGSLIIRDTRYDPAGNYPDYTIYRLPASAFTYDNLAQRYDYSQSNGVSLLSIQDPDGSVSYPEIDSLAISKNGRYALALVRYSYVIVIDLSTNIGKIISKLADYRYMNPSPTAGAVSDDGMYAYVANLHRVFYITGQCGTESSYTYFTTSESINECESTSLSSQVAEKIPYTYKSFAIEFDQQNSIIRFNTLSLFTSDVIKHTVEIKAPYQTVQQIKYLALGDSYSSGEGDSIGNVSHYVTGTTGPGGCHLSVNAYPYKLSELLKINEVQRGIIPCSGAKSDPDVLSFIDNTSYHGQNNRYIQYRPDELLAYQTTALRQFNPGYVPQLEFVKKYQPKFVTITAGGNDVQFADIISKCVLPFKGWAVSTACEELREGTVSNNLLQQSIQGQYSRSVRIIEQIRLISPETIIYLIGYPSFVGEVSNLDCKAMGAGFLSNGEKRLINRYVTKINNTIRDAATHAGAYFIDIENSLVGGRLCEAKAEYVTGPRDVGSLASLVVDQDLRQQVFHPSALGHRRITEAIMRTHPNLGADVANPTPSTAPVDAKYLSDVDVSREITGITLKDRKVTLDIPSGSYKPNTTIQVSMFSKERIVGAFKSSGTGSLTQSFMLTNEIKKGEHTIVLTGASANSKRKILYNTIFVNEKHECQGETRSKDSNGKCSHED